MNDGTIVPSDYSSPLEYIEALNDYLRTKAIIENVNTPDKLAQGCNMFELLISCRFQDQTCTENDFIKTYDYYYGNCFRFNVGKYQNGKNKTLLKSGKTGSANGK